MVAERTLDSTAPLARAAEDAACRLAESAASSGWRGADPFDALWWHWPTGLVGGKRRRQAIIQLHARSPFDIRTLYRRTHSLIPKTLGLFASACIRLWRLTEGPRYRELALDALDVLDRDHTAGGDAWGYPWDVQLRWSFYPAGSPNIVVTAFVAHALQDGAEAFGLGEYASRARRAADWIRAALWLPQSDIFVYHKGSAVLVHNANLLGAAVVRRLLPADPTPDLAVSSTLSAQARDGSWPYGSGGGNLGFIDSFHTGYVLSCLTSFADREDVRTALERGAHYYTHRFFDSNGRALLWPGQRYPEDGHSAGTAMTTLSSLRQRDLVEQAALERVTTRVLSHGLRHDHAVHRRGRLWRSTVHYPRWCDGHVALGLSHAAETLTQVPMKSGLTAIVPTPALETS